MKQSWLALVLLAMISMSLLLIGFMAVLFVPWFAPSRRDIAVYWTSTRGWWIAIVIVVALPFLLPHAWKAYRAWHQHSHEKSLSYATRQLVIETTSLIASARENGDNVDVSFNERMTPTSVKVISAQSVGRRTVQEVPQQEMVKELAAPVSAIPEIVRYEDVKRYVPQGHALLGVSQTGEVETCDFEKLMTCWIVGGSSTGKSNTVALKIDEAMNMGRNLKLLVIDPHAKKSDSLYNKIKPYEFAFLRPVAQYEDDILATLQWFLQEFKRRLADGECTGDILLVCDEVSNVVESENEEIAKLLKKIARICGQESRGFGMFGWFISQKAAGLAWLRNVVITVIAHKMNMMSERKLACNEDMSIARDMDTWPRGRVLVYGLGFEEVRVLQQPIFTVPQRAESVFRMEDLGNRYGNSGNRDTEPSRIVDASIIDEIANVQADERKKENTPVGSETRETIRRMKMRGTVADRDIAAFVGLSGRKYGIYQQVVKELGYVKVEQEA